MDMTSDSATGQVSRSAADVYEAFFVPALFGEWADRIATAARIRTGDTVLDVACGTGAATRAAARLAGPQGRIIGLDCNPGMLETARRLEPGIEWREGRAEALPFADSTFDAVTCQFGLMFFADRVKALREMWRVLRPGGRLAVAVWSRIESSPGYAAMAQLIEHLFGSVAADALRAPFMLGDTDEVAALFASAGISTTRISTRTGTARFPSIDAWVHTDVKGWTLADLIDDTQYGMLKHAAQRELADFADTDGQVRFDAPAHIVTATRN